jgi:CRISPR-associated protein Csm5
MTNKLLTMYRMRIESLTALHVGTGEVVNPGEYFVFDDVAYFVDLGAIAARLKPEYRRKFPQQDTEMLTWIREARKDDDLKRIIQLAARFRARLGEDASDINDKWGSGSTALAVSLLPRALSGPYLPGSSIKGALRTALIAASFPAGCNPPDKSRALAEWERKTLGAREVIDRYGKNHGYAIEADPLRDLRVSDAASSTDIATEIHRVSREGMKPGGDAADLQDYRECFPGSFFLGQRYHLQGSVTIVAPYHAPANPRIARAALLQACHDFYLRALEADIAYWRARDGDMAELCEAIKLDAEENPTEWALIRLGWGCGRDAMSLNQCRPEPLLSKTRALVGDAVAGWALISLEEK